jgi:cytochrome c-type biogenesis protein CcmF
LAWKRGDLLGVAQRLLWAAAVALIAVAAVFAMAGVRATLAPFAIGLAVFVIGGAITDLVERTGLFRVAPAVAARRAVGLPRATWGTALAHLGVGLALIGIVAETVWGAERIVALKPGQVVSLRNYDLTFEGLVPRQGPNYRALEGRFTVRRSGAVLGVMEPSKRVFPSRGDTVTTEAALMTRGLSQLYLSLGDQNADGSVTVRLYHKPLVLLIWIGPLIMVLGGALSLSDRRLRIGAPRPARARAALQPAE